LSREEDTPEKFKSIILILLPQEFKMSICASKNIAENSDRQTRDRSIFAARVFCRLCEEHKIKTCSWEKSPAWREYVEGKIDEVELALRAEANIRDFVKMVWESGDSKAPAVKVSQDQKAQRAKIANKIYRNACTKSGLNNCFFKNFETWSEYVNGMMDEDAFIESAIFEVLEIKREGGYGEKQ
jgi:hypothetical protein